MPINKESFRDTSTCPGCPHLSYVRILNAYPAIRTSIDVYFNTTLVASDISYQEFTPYIPIAEGSYNISIFPHNSKSIPMETKSFLLKGHSIYTLAFSGQNSSFELEDFMEPYIKMPKGKSLIRFAHLSPDAPSVNLTLENGKVLFTNIKYKELTEYISVSPGIYTLQLRLPENNNAVLTVPNVLFKPERYYTVYAVGLVSGNPPLELLLPLDGNSYIKFN